MHGGGGTSPSGQKKARIEIIPLIDVVFFLLATFVLFTLSLNKQQGQPVQLPYADSGNPIESAKESVTLTVSDNSLLYWNKDPITLDEFLTRIKNYKASEPDPVIMINGDDRAFAGQVLYVLDQVRIAGISHVSIETRLTPAGQQ